jgi:hypothetical protein
MNRSNRSEYLNSAKIKSERKTGNQRSLKKSNTALSILLTVIMMFSVILPGTVWGENENEQPGTSVLGGVLVK